jgi:hypothetical protein
MSVPLYQMGVHARMQSTVADPTYQAPAPASVSYHPLVSPSHYTHPEQQHPMSRYSAAEAMHHPPSLRRQPSPSVLIPSQSQIASTSRIAPQPTSPSVPTNPKSSPLSLSSITSPFEQQQQQQQQHPESQSKNLNAQTFILGERLRAITLVPNASAIPTTRRRRRISRHHLRVYRRTSAITIRRRARRQDSRPFKCRRGDSAILPSCLKKGIERASKVRRTCSRSGDPFLDLFFL